MPLAPPVIKIVLLLSFIITYLLNYLTIDKVARKLSAARHKHSVPRMHGETACQGGVPRPALPEIRGTIGMIVLDLPARRGWGTDRGRFRDDQSGRSLLGIVFGLQRGRHVIDRPSAHAGEW